MIVQEEALFIMPENLVKASDYKYIDVYSNLEIPIFFIGMTKTFIPFIFKDNTYQNVTEAPQIVMQLGICIIQ